MNLSSLAIAILIFQILSGLYGVYLMMGCIRGIRYERTVREARQ